MMSDVLTETATRLEMEVYDLFREICSSSDITAKRLDALWSGYSTELYIPEFVEAACFKIMLGTTKGGSP